MRRALVLAGVALLLATEARAQQADTDPWFGHDKALHFAAVGRPRHRGAQGGLGPHRPWRRLLEGSRLGFGRDDHRDLRGLRDRLDDLAPSHPGTGTLIIENDSSMTSTQALELKKTGA